MLRDKGAGGGVFCLCSVRWEIANSNECLVGLVSVVKYFEAVSYDVCGIVDIL